MASARFRGFRRALRSNALRQAAGLPCSRTFGGRQHIPAPPVFLTRASSLSGFVVVLARHDAAGRVPARTGAGPGAMRHPPTPKASEDRAHRAAFGVSALRVTPPHALSRLPAAASLAADAAGLRTRWVLARASTFRPKSRCGFAQGREDRIAFRVPAKVLALATPGSRRRAGLQQLLQPKTKKERKPAMRSEEHTSELQSRQYLVCRLLLEKKKKQIN